MVTYAPVLIDPPTVAPLRFGLLNAAQVVPHGDARFGMGVQYQADYCGEATDTAGICEDMGTLSVAGDGTDTVTVTAAEFPDGTFSVLWGDEAEGDDPESVDDLDGATHTYGTPEDAPFTIIVTGPRSYRAVVEVDPTDESDVDATVGVSKLATEGIDLVEAQAFAVMHLFRCLAPGTIENGSDRARRSLQLGEGRAVERVVARQLARDERAVKLATSPMHAIDGLAMLEKYAAANYPGEATIHMTRDVGTILTSLGAAGRYTDGGVEHLETRQGSRIASGGGYAPLREPAVSGTLTTNADGVEWLYVTGAVVAHRSESIDVRPQISTSPADNVFSALSERLYAVTSECIVAAVPVHTSYVVPAA